MKENKQKGFTLIELLGVVVILGIISTIAIVSYSNYVDRSRAQSYAIAENTMKTAVIDVYADCEDSFNRPALCDTKSAPASKGQTVKISLQELLQYNYLERINDPARTGKFCDSNRSYVEVTNTTEEEAFNTSYQYEVCLRCSKYQSPSCK